MSEWDDFRDTVSCTTDVKPKKAKRIFMGNRKKLTREQRAFLAGARWDASNGCDHAKDVRNAAIRWSKKHRHEHLGGFVTAKGYAN